MSKKLLFNNSSTSDGGDDGGDNGEIVISTFQGCPDGDNWIEDDVTIISTDKIPVVGDIYIKVTPTDPNDDKLYYAYYADYYDEEGKHLGYEGCVTDCTNNFGFVCRSTSIAKYISVEIGTGNWDPITPDDVIVTYKIVTTSSGDEILPEGDWVEADMQMGQWISATELVPYDMSYMGTYLHSSEVINVDGIKEVMVHGVNYVPDIGIGVYLFNSDGETIAFTPTTELINVDTNTLILADLEAVYETTIASIAFGIFAEENTASLLYILIKDGESGGGGSGGTEQESDWVEADMQVGVWLTITELVPYGDDSEELRIHSSEIIYLDGITEIYVQGVNYYQEFGIGACLFIEAGANAWSANLDELLIDSESNVLNVEYVRELGETYIEITPVAIAFMVAAEENTASLRYKLIKG